MIQVSVTKPVTVSETFTTLALALGCVKHLMVHKARGIKLNVDLTTAKYDKLNRLEEANYPWIVSHLSEL